MKRSEMITNIVKDSDGKYNENTIKEILFLLESYGMLPPVRLQKSVLPGINDFLVNEWEDEES